MVLSPLPRLYRLPATSFFLFGLRGVGKSTWIRRQLPDAHRFDLLDEALYQSLLADPSLFAAELRRLEPESWVVVDEVQRLPGLLNEVHRAIEDRRLRFALLGSSARKLRAAGVNLLAGRALWREMYPLTPEELGEVFDLDRALAVGGLPLVLDSPEPAETLVQAAREVGAVALAKGVRFDEDPPSLAAEAARNAETSHSPMFHDLGRGSRTEIDALCGAVVREGRSSACPRP